MQTGETETRQASPREHVSAAVGEEASGHPRDPRGTARYITARASVHQHCLASLCGRSSCTLTCTRTSKLGRNLTQVHWCSRSKQEPVLRAAPARWSLDLTTRVLVTSWWRPARQKLCRSTDGISQLVVCVKTPVRWKNARKPSLVYQLCHTRTHTRTHRVGSL